LIGINHWPGLYCHTAFLQESKKKQQSHKNQQ